MDNRRDSYRVRLAAGEEIPAELALAPGKSLPARIVSMSVGGIGVVLGKAEMGLAVHQRMTIRFTLPKAILPLSFDMQIRRVGAGGVTLGLAFLSSGDAKQDEEREKKIWPFLLEFQNREIRGLRKIPPRPR